MFRKRDPDAIRTEKLQLLSEICIGATMPDVEYPRLRPCLLQGIGDIHCTDGEYRLREWFCICRDQEDPHSMFLSVLGR